MSFYREANLEDTRKAKEELEYYFPIEVYNLIHSANDRDNIKAPSVLNSYERTGIEACKKIIDEYKKILVAERHILQGKIVYTEY